MQLLYHILLCGALLLCSTACKKYPEGGFVNQTRKHLFGGNKVGDHKTWKLKRYEVNGIDSTYLIQGANSIPNFYDQFVTFTYKGREVSDKYDASTYIQNYSGTMIKKGTDLLIAYNWINKEDSMQCKIINNQRFCQRNIFFPEFLKRNPAWQIKKLTREELILSIQLTNSYKIILSN